MKNEQMIKEIGIFGVGGVGGYFGGKLCQLQDDENDVRVSFLARGPHLQAIQEKGLLLHTEKEGSLFCHPALATDSIEELPKLDLCILCVKGFDLNDLLLKLRGLIDEKTIILPLLNGADVYERIRSVIDRGIVLPACVYVGTHIESPGVVAQKGGACKILFGADPQHPEFSLNGLLTLLQDARILCEREADVQVAIWEKFIFISSFGLVTAAHQKSIGEVLEDSSLREMVSCVVKEAVSVARKLGIQLPDNIAVAAIEKGDHFPYETKTSFQRDFEQIGKKDERDLFAGTLLKYATQLGIETPVTAKIFAELEQMKPAVRHG